MSEELPTYEDLDVGMPIKARTRLSLRSTLGHRTHRDGPFRDCWFCRRVVDREVKRWIYDQAPPESKP